MSYSKPVIKLSKIKLKPMLENIWTYLETPIFVDSIVFKKSTDKKARTGFAILTHGALYLFKTKLIQNPKLFHTISILDYDEIIYSKESGNSILLSSEKNTVKLSKCSHMKELFEKLAFVLFECSFGVENIILPKFTPDVYHEVKNTILYNFQQDSSNQSNEKSNYRPEDALIKRCLFFAHFYHKYGKNLYEASYLKKYDDKVLPFLSIGPRFHLGNFASAYGHAMGWETNLNKLIFSNYRSRYTPLFLESLLINSQTINQIVFADYGQGKYIEFKFDKVTRTIVDSFWFHGCCINIITKFLNSCINYKCRISEFCLSNCTMTTSEFSKVLSGLVTIDCFKHLHSFTITGINFDPFPNDAFLSFLKKSDHLESLTVSNINVDGSLILATICRSDSILYKLKLNNLNFNGALNTTKLAIPSNLIMIEFSKSKFTMHALKSTLELLTSDAPISSSFIVRMNSIRLKPSCLDAFKNLNLAKCKPNICEFDFSNNILSVEAIPHFFNFLKTQNRLRILSVFNLNLQKQDPFIEALILYLKDSRVPGIDYGSPKILHKNSLIFLEALEKFTWLRRIKVSFPNGGDDACSYLVHIIEALPALTEFFADDLKPDTTENFFKLWEAVLTSKSILANNVPNTDINYLNITSNEHKKLIFHKLRNRPLPSLAEQRADFSIMQIKSQFDSSTTCVSDDIFYGTLTTTWVDTTVDTNLKIIETRQISDNDFLDNDDENDDEQSPKKQQIENNHKYNNDKDNNDKDNNDKDNNEKNNNEKDNDGKDNNDKDNNEKDNNANKYDIHDDLKENNIFSRHDINGMCNNVDVIQASEYVEIDLPLPTYDDENEKLEGNGVHTFH
ncbi:hypothetical protein TRFO_23327 [Tritrichomonas foetus]|uniref:Uncharacterized protein n=1 Tax=Tritrichomonas foetus TaxID=1144522 RepID=A0A1J4K9T7_9EUKA|nr:hypothetical protein TRFO_23327 [Tritrichomonas foetus]|eukprot:OHT08191.1 hypothetical protein TRFO_23327 [Tritrichomonas foetus]